MTYSQILNHLMESHPTWCRRICVLAARLYLGIDHIRLYEWGLMVSMAGEPLLSPSELREVTSSWWSLQARTLQPAWASAAREEKLNVA